MQTGKATLIGFGAILLWSTIVGLLRSVCEGIGPIGGVAMIYSVSTVVLLCVFGVPKLLKFPRKYLLIGCSLFVSYEICLSLSVGFARSSSQAIEVSMVNYLWPSLTLLLSIIADKKKPSLLMLVGMAVCILGISKVLAGNGDFSLSQMISNISTNPVSYLLAFLGAIIWSVYCVITKKMAKGHNGIVLFFASTAVILWLIYLSTPNESLHFNTRIIIDLLLASAAMGLGHAAWNVGMLHGNVTLLATASYFIPVLSSFLATLILFESLGLQFWIGALLVCFGSLICWKANRPRSLKRH